MHEEVVAAVELWDRWVTEIEEGPLDIVEYEAMLASRDDVAELIEIAGSSSLWARCDEIDARFRDVTRDVDDSPLRERASSGWWWKRVPGSDEAIRYLRGDY